MVRIHSWGITLSFLFYTKNLYLQVTVDDERKRCQSETKLSSNVRTRATRVYIEFAMSIRNSPLRKPHPSPLPGGRRWLPFLASIPRHPPQHSNSINIFRRSSQLFPSPPVLLLLLLPPEKNPDSFNRNNRSFRVLFFFFFFLF